MNGRTIAQATTSIDISPTTSGNNAPGLKYELKPKSGQDRLQQETRQNFTLSSMAADNMEMREFTNPV